MQRLFLKTLSLVALILGLLVVGVPITSAQTLTQQWCNTVTVDDANLFGGQKTTVDNAAQALIRSGADVRVRTYPNLGNAGSIDNFEKNLVNSCQSWRSSTGMNDNLIVISFSKNPNPGQSGIYYGSRWKPALDVNYQKIRSDTFNALLRSGKYPDAFIQTLNQIQSLVDKQVHPAQTTQVTKAQTAPAQPAKPTGTPWALIIILALLTVAAVWAIWYFVIRPNSREERENTSGAQEAAKQAQRSAVDKSSFDYQKTISDLRGSVILHQDRGASVLSPKLDQAERYIQTAIGNYGTVSRSVSDPGKPGLTIAQYQAIEHGYTDEILGYFKLADNLIGEITQSLNKLDADPNATLNQPAAGGSGTTSTAPSPSPATTPASPSPATSPAPGPSPTPMPTPISSVDQVKAEAQREIETAKTEVAKAHQAISELRDYTRRSTREEYLQAYNKLTEALDARSYRAQIRDAISAQSHAREALQMAREDYTKRRWYGGYFDDPIPVWGYEPAYIVVGPFWPAPLYSPAGEPLYTENGGGGSIGISDTGSGGGGSIGQSDSGNGGGESLYTPDPMPAYSDPEPSLSDFGGGSDSFDSDSSDSDFGSGDGGGGDI